MNVEGEKAYLNFVIQAALAYLKADNLEEAQEIICRYAKEYRKDDNK